MFGVPGCMRKNSKIWVILVTINLISMLIGTYIGRFYLDHQFNRENYAYTESNKTTRLITETASFQNNKKTNKSNEFLKVSINKLESNKSVIFECRKLKFPSIKQLDINNTHWQVMKYSRLISITGARWYIYSSYYDNRTLLNNNPVIRLIGMVNMNSAIHKVKTYCQIWYSNNTKYVISQVSRYYHLAPTHYNVYLQPYLIICPIQREIVHEVPTSVSLVEEPCDTPTNVVKVINNIPEDGVKKDIAICIKGLDFADIDKSIYLVEWMELNFLLGVDTISFHNLNIHPNISKVLNYYESLGKIQVSPLTLPGYQFDHPSSVHKFLYTKKNQQIYEKIPFHDCFYANINRYKYIAILDIDEVFLPTKGRDLKSLVEVKTKNNPNYPSLSFTRVMLLDAMRELRGYNPDIPEYMYLSQNVYRSPRSEGDPKSLLNTESVLSFSTHNPLQCLLPFCKKIILYKGASCFHYRSGCKRGKENFCNLDKSFEDTRIWNFRDHLIERTKFTLELLGLI